MAKIQIILLLLNSIVINQIVANKTITKRSNLVSKFSSNPLFLSFFNHGADFDDYSDESRVIPHYYYGPPSLDSDESSSEEEHDDSSEERETFFEKFKIVNPQRDYEEPSGNHRSDLPSTDFKSLPIYEKTIKFHNHDESDSVESEEAPHDFKSLPFYEKSVKFHDNEDEVHDFKFLPHYDTTIKFHEAPNHNDDDVEPHDDAPNNFKTLPLYEKSEKFHDTTIKFHEAPNDDIKPHDDAANDFKTLPLYEKSEKFHDEVPEHTNVATKSISNTEDVPPKFNLLPYFEPQTKFKNPETSTKKPKIQLVKSIPVYEIHEVIHPNPEDKTKQVVVASTLAPIVQHHPTPKIENLDVHTNFELLKQLSIDQQLETQNRRVTTVKLPPKLNYVLVPRKHIGQASEVSTVQRPKTLVTVKPQFIPRRDKTGLPEKAATVSFKSVINFAQSNISKNNEQQTLSGRQKFRNLGEVPLQTASGKGLKDSYGNLIF